MERELEDSIEGDPFLLYLNACNNGISDSIFVMSAMVENKSKRGHKTKCLRLLITKANDIRD